VTSPRFPEAPVDVAVPSDDRGIRHANGPTINDDAMSGHHRNPLAVVTKLDHT
jgi:hypothetical protein